MPHVGGTNREVEVAEEGHLQETSEYRLKETGYSCRDGVWFRNVDVTSRDGTPVERNRAEKLHLTGNGYCCKDGVWYMKVGVATRS